MHHQQWADLCTCPFLGRRFLKLLNIPKKLPFRITLDSGLMFAHIFLNLTDKTLDHQLTFAIIHKILDRGLVFLYLTSWESTGYVVGLVFS